MVFGFAANRFLRLAFSAASCSFIRSAAAIAFFCLALSAFSLSIRSCDRAMAASSLEVLASLDVRSSARCPRRVARRLFVRR